MIPSVAITTAWLERDSVVTECHIMLLLNTSQVTSYSLVAFLLFLIQLFCCFVVQIINVAFIPLSYMLVDTQIVTLCFLYINILFGYSNEPIALLTPSICQKAMPSFQGIYKFPLDTTTPHPPPATHDVYTIASAAGKTGAHVSCFL